MCIVVLHVTPFLKSEEKMSYEDLHEDGESEIETDHLSVSHLQDKDGEENGTLAEKVSVSKRNEVEQNRLKSKKKSHKHVQNARENKQRCVSNARKEKTKHKPKSELNQDHVCDICNKTYSSKDSLRLHRKIHSGKKDFVCKTCGRAFGRYDHLRNHELSHQGKQSSKQYICDTCGKSYVDKRALKDHLAIHSGVQQYFCDICGNGFWHKTGLRKHVNQVHSRKCINNESIPDHRKAKACTCEVCGKILCTQDALKRHMHIHTGEKEASCSICKRDFMTKHSLKRHLMRRHNPLKVYKTPIESCSICNIDFSARRYYLNHVNSKHSELRVKRKASDTEKEAEKLNSDKVKQDDKNKVSLLKISKKGQKDICYGEPFPENGEFINKTASTSTDNTRHAHDYTCLDYTVPKIKTEVINTEEDTIPYCHSPTDFKTQESQEANTPFNLSYLIRNINAKSGICRSKSVDAVAEQDESMKGIRTVASGIKVAVSLGLDNLPTVQIKDELDDFAPMENNDENDDDDHLEPMEPDLN